MHMNNCLIFLTFKCFSLSANVLSNGLGNGGIAAVVIACVLILVLAALGVFILKRRGIVKPPTFREADGSLGFDNAMYSKSDDKVQLEADA